MKDIAALTVFGALKGFCLDAPRQSGGGPGRLKFGRRILLRDFRTVRRGEVVNFNIGTAAHAPGTLAVLKKHLGDDLQITVWADAPLSEPLARLMRRRFPEVEIVHGRLDGTESAALKRAVDEADLFLVSSGASIDVSVRRSLVEFQQRTGKPVGAYAIGCSPKTIPWIDRLAFAWFRDPVSAKIAAERSVCPLQGWAPDAVFDFDCADKEGATAFLKEHDLQPGGFICCIPGQRYTPRWKYFKFPARPELDAANAKWEEHDNAPLFPIIRGAVERFGLKVLLCAEQESEIPLVRRLVYDRLPPKLRTRCVPLETLWSPDLALGIYRASRGVFGVEMHSQVMAAGSGIPAVLLRHPQFGTKSEMWKTIGLSDWLADSEQPDYCARAEAAAMDILSDPDGAAKKLRNARRIIDRAAADALHKTFSPDIA